MPEIGECIGGVQLVERLGSGGMGEVWEGVDQRLGRSVAVKMVQRSGSTDAEARLRFVREARILSRLEHPNICRLYAFVEGEEADYLVMELVRGQTLRHAIADGLGPDRVVEIVTGICSALAAAHAVSIVHRDLKPENVMLAEDGTVKVLDFGLALQLEEEEAPELADVMGPTGSSPRSPWTPEDGESLTRTGEVVGTPLYMCPEQAVGGTVTAAGDMFVLGLVLHEMLTGHSAYASEGGPLDVIRRARWADVRPLAGVDRSLASLVTDLTAFEPQQRPTAEATLARLQHLRTRPMRRLRRAAVAVAVLGLVTGTILSLAGLQRARQEAASALATTDFLADLFRASDPHQGGVGPDASAREILARGVERLQGRLNEQPATRVRLLTTLGAIHGNLGLGSEATALLEEALTVQEELTGPTSAELLPILLPLANAVADQAEWANAGRLFARAITIAEQHDRRAEHATALNLLGVTLTRQARQDEAEEALRQALAERTALLGADHPDTTATSTNLALVLLDRGHYREAEQRLSQALVAAERHLEPNDPDVPLIVVNLATARKELGRYAEAEGLYRRAIDTTRKRLGEHHPQVAMAVNNLAVDLFALGRYEEAEATYRDAVATATESLGASHPVRAMLLSNLAEACTLINRPAEGERLARQALEILRSALGPDHPALAEARRVLALAMAGLGRPAEAEEQLLESLRIREAADPAHADVGRTLAQLARLYRAQGRGAEADAALARARTILTAALGAEHPDVLALDEPGSSGAAQRQ